MVRLEPMSAEDFQACANRSIARHAADQVSRGLWTEEAALEASRSDFAQLLPEGRETPNRHFVNVIEVSSGRRVGEAWYLAEVKGGKTQFWIDWVFIEPQHRRRGYATQVLQQLAAEASRLGADRVGLSVLSDNVEALALYTKLGFRQTRFGMSRPLTAVRDR